MKSGQAQFWKFNFRSSMIWMQYKIHTRFDTNGQEMEILGVLERHFPGDPTMSTPLMYGDNHHFDSLVIP
jgi:hypothetical protein